MRPGLGTVLREWGRIGCIGFGGPPTHIALLRALCVERRQWLPEREFEDAIAACNLLPGPASTQLAIFCAWRVRGRAGALVGGAAFIVPGLLVILALAALFLTGTPPLWVRGAGAGAGAAVAAVAVHAGVGLIPASWRRAAAAIAEPRSRSTAAGGDLLPDGSQRVTTTDGELPPDHSRDTTRVLGNLSPDNPQPTPPADGDLRPGGRRRAVTTARLRWAFYLGLGAAAAATLGPWLVLVLLGCGLVELVVRRAGSPLLALPAQHLAAGVGGAGVFLSVAWVALKVGALSYGGGFVIIPLMRADAVDHYHWMTGGQFLNAVALGQITPGPVVQTVAVVGYAAAGLAGGVLASAVAFTPSFLFVLVGARHFDRLRGNPSVRSFLDGAGPAAVGAILGSAVPLALSLDRAWQFAVLAGAGILLLAFKRGVVTTLLTAAAAGSVLAISGVLPGF